jgi:hypothetical protein
MRGAQELRSAHQFGVCLVKTQAALLSKEFGADCLVVIMLNMKLTVFRFKYRNMYGTMQEEIFL